MLQYLEKKQKGDEVVATSLIRLLRNCDDPRKNPVMLKMMQDRSPLVRSAAADALALYPTRGNLQALVKATGDEYRVVRIRAAAGLAGRTGLALSEADKKNIEKANREYLQSIKIPPDHWASYYNEGNYYLNLGNYRQAITGYETSIRLEPQGVMSRVNMSIAYARLGENKKADSIPEGGPENIAGQCRGQSQHGAPQGRAGRPEGRREISPAGLEGRPEDGPGGLQPLHHPLGEQAGRGHRVVPESNEASPSNPKFAYSLAYYERKKGDTEAAIGTLRNLIARNPDYPDAYVLLGEIYERQGRVNEARTVYQQALWNPDIPAQSRTYIEQRIRALSGRR